MASTAPASASSRAMARPTRRAAPVTSATLPTSGRMVSSGMEPIVREMRLTIKHVGRGPRLAKELSLDEARQAMEQIVAGRADPYQVGAFLLAMRMKGESAEELAGFA